MKYKVLHRVNSHPIDSEIELTDAEAAKLLDSGAIEPIVKPFSKRFAKTPLHLSNQDD